MTNPAITVGIPNYNGAKYLELAIESVLHQTFSDFDVIISDDGSTDNSIEIIKRYQGNPKVTIIAGSENKGLSYRLNEQIRLARGKYFCRMDSDDIMMPYRLEKEFNFLESNPDVDVVGGAVIVIDEINSIIGTRAIIDYVGESYNCSGFIHPTVMGNISFFRKNIYSELYSGVEDTELWLRCRNNSNFKTLNYPILFYRDPLKLRVGTYLSRLTLIEKLFEDYYCYSNCKSKFSYFFSRAKIKYQKLVVRLLGIIGATSIWVKRRNNQCTSEQYIFFKTILDEQTRITDTY